jgi:hypothetical protein
MQITASTELAAIALRFAPGGVFSTIPPVSLASIIQPALGWFDSRPWLSPFSAMARLLMGVQFRLG